MTDTTLNPTTDTAVKPEPEVLPMPVPTSTVETEIKHVIVDVDDFANKVWSKIKAETDAVKGDAEDLAKDIEKWYIKQQFKNLILAGVIAATLVVVYGAWDLFTTHKPKPVIEKGVVPEVPTIKAPVDKTLHHKPITCHKKIIDLDAETNKLLPTN